MKDTILKMAGVRSESALYKKYPDEKSFMAKFGKQFKKAQVGASIGGNTQSFKPINFNDEYNQADYNITGQTNQMRQQQSYQQSMLANQQKQGQNNNNIGQTIGQLAPMITGAKKGAKIKKALGGINQSSNTQYDESGQYYQETPGEGLPTKDITDQPNYSEYQQWQNTQGLPNLQSSTNPANTNSSKGNQDLLNTIGKFSGPAGKLVQGIQELGAEKKQRQSANQMDQVSKLALQASNTRPELTQRRYVRPEDIQNTGEEFYPVYGAGTNVLGKDGLSLSNRVGGNPSEIQNTYAPNNIYTDDGYEPLNDADKAKAFYFGGKMEKAVDGWFGGNTNWGKGTDMYNFADKGGSDIASKLITGIGGQNAGGDIGGNIGNTIGSAVGGPIGGMIGQVGGQVIGGLLDRNPHKIKQYQQDTQRNIGNMAFNQGMRGTQQQYTSYMKDGGSSSKPKYLDLPNTSMEGFDRLGQNYSPSLEQSKQDSIEYRNNFNAITANPKMFNERNALQRLTELGQISPNNGMSEGQQREMYAKAHQFYTAGIDALEQLKNKSNIQNYIPNDRVKSSYSSVGSPLFEEGGWMNPEYNPQVITKFGNVDVSDIHNIATKGMNTLRTGGNIKQNNFYPQDQFVMGGELQTHWGGYAEPISQNPYLPDGGETVMFRGNSHEQSDGQGNDGIGVTYGNNPVEVEHGEPAVKLQDGSGEDNLVVFGNLPIHNSYLPLLGDDDAKGKKFKNYVADLSKNEEKHNSTIDKSTKLLNDMDVHTPMDQLKFNSLKANINGSMNSLKDIAEKKQNAAHLQQAINDTAEEQGLVADDLARGKIKQAKRGINIKKAITGTKEPLGITNTNPDNNIIDPNPIQSKSLPQEWPQNSNQFLISRPNIPMFSLPTDYNVGTDRNIPNKPNTWGDVGMSYANQILPYIRPSVNIAQPDLTKEMLTAGMNQQQPVYTQKYQPQLLSSYDISLNDQLSSIDSQARSAIKASGQNPAAQSAIMAQANDQKNKVLGEQFRINQQNKSQTYNQNINTLNNASQENYKRLDEQQVRQSTAASRTKEQQLAIAGSISDKMAQARREQTLSNLESQRYNYRFGPNGVPINMNPFAQFNTNMGNSQQTGMIPGTIMGANGQPMYPQYKNGRLSYEPIEQATLDEPGYTPIKHKGHSKNGSIVSAIKRL